MFRAASLDRVLAVFVVVAGVAGLIAAARVSRKEPGAATQEAGKLAKRSGLSIKLGTELTESYGIRTESAKQTRYQTRRLVYGRVIPNPQATTEIRSPIAGVLKTQRKSWLQVGERIGPNEPLGTIEARISPQELLDFKSKAIEAEEKAKGLEEGLGIHEERVRRLERIGDTVARAEIDQARIQQADAKSQYLAARGQAKLWRDAIKSADASSITWPLATPAGGEVAEVLAQPGTAVEAGAAIAKIVDASKVLIRLDFEVQQVAPEEADVSIAEENGDSARSIRAKRIGPTFAVDANSQHVGQLYEARINAPSSIWRAGLFVKAHAGEVGHARDAVTTSTKALLFHMGAASGLRASVAGPL